MYVSVKHFQFCYRTQTHEQLMFGMLRPVIMDIFRLLLISAKCLEIPEVGIPVLKSVGVRRKITRTKPTQIPIPLRHYRYQVQGAPEFIFSIEKISIRRNGRQIDYAATLITLPTLRQTMRKSLAWVLAFTCESCSLETRDGHSHLVKHMCGPWSV